MVGGAMSGRGRAGTFPGGGGWGAPPGGGWGGDNFFFQGGGGGVKKEPGGGKANYSQHSASQEFLFPNTHNNQQWGRGARGASFIHPGGGSSMERTKRMTGIYDPTNYKPPTPPHPPQLRVTPQSQS